VGIAQLVAHEAGECIHCCEGWRPLFQNDLGKTYFTGMGGNGYENGNRFSDSVGNEIKFGINGNVGMEVSTAYRLTYIL